jgi:hypothetical protein
MEELLRDLNHVFGELVKAKEYLHIYRAEDSAKNITRVYQPYDTKLLELVKNNKSIRFKRVDELYGAAANNKTIQQVYADMQHNIKSQEYEAAAQKREELIKLQMELSKKKAIEDDFTATFIKKISNSEIGYHYSPCHFINGYLEEVLKKNI